MVDVGWPVGRRLVESYQIGLDATLPYGLRFLLGQAVHTLYQALAGAGYVGHATPTLAQVYMGMYNDGAQVYVAAGQLVVNGGAFLAAPAQLKTLSAGANVALADDGGVITITSTVDEVVGPQGREGEVDCKGAQGPVGDDGAQGATGVRDATAPKVPWELRARKETKEKLELKVLKVLLGLKVPLGLKVLLALRALWERTETTMDGSAAPTPPVVITT